MIVHIDTNIDDANDVKANDCILHFPEATKIVLHICRINKKNQSTNRTTTTRSSTLR